MRRFIMKLKSLIILSILIAFAITAISLNVQAKKTTQDEESTYQESGEPLYFDPNKTKGKGVDDTAPYSDPWYGKESTYKGGHGSQPGPAGQTEEPTEVKIIEGPKYEVPKKYEEYKEGAEGETETKTETQHNRWHD
jgi:hypothetical protein